MNGAQMLPAALGGAAAAFIAFGAYEAIKPYAWDRMNLTGPGGYIATAVDMIPVGSMNVKADLTNFAEKSLALGTIGGLAYLASSKKALGMVDAKLAQGAVGLASVIYAVQFLGEIQTLNLGSVFGNLAQGRIGNARNAFASNPGGNAGFGNTGLANNAVFRSAHNQNMMAIPMTPANGKYLEHSSMAEHTTNCRLQTLLLFKEEPDDPLSLRTKPWRFSCEPLLSLTNFVR